MTVELKAGPGLRGIELGCGDQPHPSCCVHVDVRANQHTDFACDFNEPLPIADADFDFAYSRYCIEHLSWRRVRSFIGEMHRIVKPGGKVVVVTANLYEQCKMFAEKDDGGEMEDRWVCQIFGDNDYPENTHRCGFSPKFAIQLFREAGFEKVVVSPLPEWKGDMVIEAVKPLNLEVAEGTVEIRKLTNGTFHEGAKIIAEQFSQAVTTEPPELTEFLKEAKDSKYASFGGSIVFPNKIEPVIPAVSPFVSPNRADMTAEQRSALFGMRYFDNYQSGGLYFDHPRYEMVARAVLARKPESVLELGCGRGYVLKRLQDAGIKAHGIDVSKHCQMTRVAGDFHAWDLCRTPWNVFTGKEGVTDKFDLCFSLSFFEHVPEERLPTVFAEMERTCKRGLHAIDLNSRVEDDPTRCTLGHDKAWWQERMPLGHEVVNKAELEQGQLDDYFKGDGRIKLNLGCAHTCFYDGWVNVDHLDVAQFCQILRYEFRQLDVRQGLPWKTGEVDLIYSSHMLEHLTYGEGLSLLRECRRVLKPDGAMRLLVPDAALLMGSYDKATDAICDEWDYPTLSDFDEVNLVCAEAPTALAKLHALLHDHHQAAYDWPTLEQTLSAAGFLPYHSSFRSTSMQEPVRRETLDSLPCLSLYADAVPHVV